MKMDLEQFVSTADGEIAKRSIGEDFLVRDIIPDADWTPLSDAQRRGFGKAFWNQMKKGRFDLRGYRVVEVERSNPQRYRKVLADILLKDATPQQLHDRCIEVGWDLVIEAAQENI
jgi:hypothetical protein